MRLALATLLFFTSLAAFADPPGRFDYWVLSLSWSPQYCADRSRDQQCDRPYGFVVHGLWPQNEAGYPENCGRTVELDRSLIERMLPLMPSRKLIEHEWHTHGVCSGMSMDDYFLTIERAYRRISVPSVYRDPGEYLSTRTEDVQRAFAAANPGLSAQRMSLQCAGRYLKEVRICYDKNFKFRDCGEDMNDRCREQIVLRPAR